MSIAIETNDRQNMAVSNTAHSPSRELVDPLWQRLNDFTLDLPDVGLNFSERLAKENGWSLTYARRVIEEYKRFVFLAMRSGHVACPSEDVEFCFFTKFDFGPYATFETMIFQMSIGFGLK
ncbi:MAG: hypothetical protein AAF483_30325 [Planctomycetota bacterium]